MAVPTAARIAAAALPSASPRHRTIPDFEINSENAIKLRALTGGIAVCVERPFLRIICAAQAPFRKRRKIVRQGFDRASQLENGPPSFRNRFHSTRRAEEISGYRACRVAVPAMIHFQND